MNCRFVLNRLSSYIDSELKGDEMFAVRQHLHQCASCTKELSEQAAVKKVLSSLPALSAEGIEDRLLRAVRGESPAPEPVAPAWPNWRTAFAVAGLAVMVFGVLYFQRSSGSPEASPNSTDIAMDQDWNSAGGPFNSTTIPTGLEVR